MGQWVRMGGIMANRQRGDWQTKPGTVAELLAADATLAGLDVARWIERTYRAAEVPSPVDIAKRDGLIADLARRLNS